MRLEDYIYEAIRGRNSGKQSVPHPPEPVCSGDEVADWLESIGIHGIKYDSIQSAQVPDMSKGGVEYRIRWLRNAKKGWVTIYTKNLDILMGIGEYRSGHKLEDCLCRLTVTKDRRAIHILWQDAIELIERLSKNPNFKITKSYIESLEKWYDLSDSTLHVRQNSIDESISGNRGKIHRKYGSEIDKNSTVNDIVSWIEENSNAKKIDRGERFSIKPKPGEMFYCVGECKKGYIDRNLNTFWVGVFITPRYYSSGKLELYIYPREGGNDKKSSVIVYETGNTFVSMESAIDLLKQIVEDPTKEPIIRID